MASHWGKDNSVFNRENVFLISKHQKEEVLAPLLSKANLSVIALPLDTDQLGTFSRKIARVGSVRETLWEKVKLGLHARPEERFFLASEGSFAFDLIPYDFEVLLFYDRLLDIKIWSQYLSYEVKYDEAEITSIEALKEFLVRNDFPRNQVMLKGSGEPYYQHAGLASEEEVLKLFNEIAANQPVSVATDMRAHANPTRMQQIKACGEKLVEKLLSTCPECNSYGFGLENTVSGLPCECCNLPTKNVLKEVYVCNRCSYKEFKPRADLKYFASAEECEFCNP